jgi:hypothetical protein
MSWPKKDNPTKDEIENGNSKEDVPRKAPKTSWEIGIKEVENVSPPFKFENEISKIKISVLFNEIINKGEYWDHIIKLLNMGETPDTSNV